jgi:hypothetical protein
MILVGFLKIWERSTVAQKWKRRIEFWGMEFRASGSKEIMIDEYASCEGVCDNFDLLAELKNAMIGLHRNASGLMKTTKIPDG